MVDNSIAGLLLASARRDQQAFRALVVIPEMNDMAIGFHAHQCIEKAPKAVLARSAVPFRRTHDLAELLDLVEDCGHAAPPFSRQLDELNPYAIEARYGLIEPFALDRRTALDIEALIGWAEAQFAQAEPKKEP